MSKTPLVIQKTKTSLDSFLIFFVIARAERPFHNLEEMQRHEYPWQAIQFF